MVRLNIATPLRRLTVRKVQNSTQPCSRFDLSVAAVVVLSVDVRDHKLAAKSLTGPFAIVVLFKLIKQMPKM
jgi:hypothetical protein